MNNYEQPITGSADAQQTFLARQAELFLFDLKNEACEHGFKPGEAWMLRLATDQEIIWLKRNHHLVISLRLFPEALLSVFRQVKQRLRQSLNKQEVELTAGDLTRDGLKHLAAFPEKEAR
ncbi:MAG: hypothetical protein JST19_03185 [Bacteroidetes bacterium]|nr:hypothetical protein [Bacteroidota bacterium]